MIKVVFLLMALCWLNLAGAQVNKFDKIKLISYIKKDLASKLEFRKGRIDSFFYSTAKHEISFDISTLSSDIIKQLYLPEYLSSDIEMNKNHNSLISKVIDSLNDQNLRFNTTCKSKYSELYPKIKGRVNEIVTFFSPVCNGWIYLEALPCFGVLSFQNKYEFNGPAYLYLFQIKDGKILNVYFGEKDYN
ncbi:MAG: hypothetical protein QM731_03325 [Chitinophagaceae bacterium]